MNRADTTTESLAAPRASAADPMTDQEADAIIVRLGELRRQIEGHWYEVGGHLYRLRDEQRQLKRIGCQKIHQLARRELGIGRRKADCLMRTYEWFGVRHPLPADLHDRVFALGWSVVDLLVGIVTAENADEWLAKAKNLGRRATREASRRFRDQRDAAKIWKDEDAMKNLGEPQPEGVAKSKQLTKLFKFRVAKGPEDSAPAKIVQDALRRAGRLGHVNRADQILQIASHYVATTSQGSDRISYLGDLEIALGVKLVAIERGRVLYGAENLNGIRTSGHGHRQPDASAESALPEAA